MAGKITTLNPSIFEFLIHDVFGAPGEFHHPGLGLGLGLRFRVMVRVRVSVRVKVMDRVRVGLGLGLGLGIGIGLGTGVVKFSGSADVFNLFFFVFHQNEPKNYELNVH